MPKFFAGMDVRKVNLNCWHTHSGNRVPQGNAGMCIGGGINHNHLELFSGLLNPPYQFTFLIRLVKLNFHIQFSSSLTDLGLNVRQRYVTIYIGLTLAEQVQVRAIEK